MKRLVRIVLTLFLIAGALCLFVAEVVLRQMVRQPHQDPVGRSLLLAALKKAGTDTGAVELGPEWTALTASDTRRLADPGLKAFSALNVRGQRIWGWYYPGQPDAGAILLCHGHSVSHNELRYVFNFLRPTGYHLLMLDFRAHGASDGEYTSIGLQEWEDVDAILKEAEKLGYLPPNRPLGAYGRSMGAATLVNGARHLPRIHAFLIEAMFPWLRRIGANDLKAYVGIPDNPFVDVAFWYASWRTGIDYLTNRPENEIGNIAPRPLLIIHDAKDVRLHRSDFERLKTAASGAQTLVFDEAGHVGAHKSEPERFEREFLSFFAAAGIPRPAGTEIVSTSSLDLK